MRFVLAIVSFVIGLLLVALAVGQRTVFAPPSSLVADSSTTSSAPVTVIPGSTLNANPGYQRINVSGSGKVFAAYGKTADVDAWVGDAEHTTLRFDAESAKLVGKTTGSEASVPSPKGSDLWYQEYDGSGQFTVRLPQDVSVLIVSDGTAAAPSDVSVTWPKDTATPSVGPLLVAGGVFALGGIVLLVLAFLHQRRGRGPRRRSGGTRPPRVRASRRAAAAGAQVPTRGRRGSRAFIAVPVVLVGTLALAGCSSDYWPQGGDPSLATPTPTASATGAAETTEPTAATKQQITRVVERIATVAKQSDGARDRDLAKTRFTGAALDLRLANYSIRGKDSGRQGTAGDLGRSGVRRVAAADRHVAAHGLRDRRRGLRRQVGTAGPDARAGHRARPVQGRLRRLARGRRQDPEPRADVDRRGAPGSAVEAPRDRPGPGRDRLRRHPVQGLEERVRRPVRHRG
ncbi:hypothetical protein QP157_12295 [Sphingomonas sp. LR61]|uniref:hypothetical protein n=1 Tax=Sphingomonas sp. LR61 TaxID=3050234 RepID=UPI002FE136B1